MHTTQITEFINTNAEEIAAQFSQEKVDVYLFLNDKLRVESVAENPVYQFVFRSYYGMDRMGLSKEFKKEYFKLQEEHKAGREFDFVQVNEQLNAYKSKRNLPVLPFGLLTKMANMINPDYPVYDQSVLKVFGYKQPSDEDLEKRMSKYLKQYQHIRNTYEDFRSQDTLEPAENIFRHRYIHRVLPGFKLMDFIFQATGEYIRKQKKKKGLKTN
jgi:hypothetical protein